jgi:hypothetical protein
MSSISVVSQFSSIFSKVEKNTIRWIALSDLRTTGPAAHQAISTCTQYLHYAVSPLLHTEIDPSTLEVISKKS